jgi:heme exporter protein A
MEDLADNTKTPITPGIALHALACDRGGRRVFEGVQAALSPGDALVVRGTNGSGKSSLLRVLAGYIPAGDGTIAWNGADIRDDIGLYQSRLHYVGHLDGVKPVLSVRENIALWSVLMGDSMDIDAALSHFGLAKLADLPAKYLSAGQKRRLNLARLGASRRPLWLLDEPAVSLDAQSVAQLEALIADHRRAGGIAIIATHNDLNIEGATVLRLGKKGPQKGSQT